MFTGNFPIKDNEHNKRYGKDGPHVINISSRDQKTPSSQTSWKRFLAEGHNKTSLIKFLSQEWSSSVYSSILATRQLYITVEEKCFVIENDTVKTCDDLVCFQEEADTRIIFHLKHASDQGFKLIKVESPDTDVELLLISFANKFSSEIHFRSGSINRPCLIDIKRIANNLSESVLNAILGFHAFTGCDSVEAFVGKGKKQPYKLMLKCSKHADVLGKLGTSLMANDIDMLLPDVMSFVSAIYGHPHITDLSHLRYHMLATRQSPSHLLPPTNNQLHYHLLRANYQAWIWKQSLEKQEDIPSPHGNGWSISEHEIKIKWTDQQLAPQEILLMISCACKKKDRCTDDGTCSCRQQGLQCTDACSCTDCQNELTDISEEGTSSDSDVDI